jgi:acetolactate synthase-1/2/3 large subunit
LEHFSSDTRRPRDEKWVQSAQQQVIKWRADFDSLKNSNAVPILPERLCKEITDALPSDALLVSDTGFAALWTGTLIDLTHPNQGYMRAAGSLGWAFPASIGAKCAVPGRPVICFTGDGGFWYHISELETACRWGINIITVVNNNGCMRQCVKGINRAYGDKPGAKDDMFKYSKVNFADIARDIGCLGLRVDRPEEIAKALRTALATNGPVLVDVVTDPEHDAPWIPPATR